jgi:hypothetical protein
VKGVIPVSPEQNRVPCVVFGDTFSSWLPCLGKLGFRAVLVVLRTGKYVQIVSHLVDSTCRIDIGLQGLAFNVLGFPTIGFFDGRLTSLFLATIHGFGLSTLIGTRVPCRPFPGWLSHSFLAVSHPDVGGITTAKLSLYAMTLNKGTLSSPLPSAPGFSVQCDASTLL